MSRQTTEAQLRAHVDLFNRNHPVGTPVRFWSDVREGDGRESVTRSEAWLLGGHTPVVQVRDQAGSIALSHVEVLEVADAGRAFCVECQAPIDGDATAARANGSRCVTCAAELGAELDREALRRGIDDAGDLFDLALELSGVPRG